MIEIKEINDKTFWHNSLGEFEDANIYQTWNFAALAQNEKIVKHIAIYANQNLIGLVQVRIRTAPILNRGIAYIFNGPVWQRKNQENSIEILSDIFSALRQRFVVNQKLLLRIKPFIFSDNNLCIYSIKEKKFNIIKRIPLYRTLVLHINSELEEIRKTFKPRWRNYLSQAEKNNLKVISGSSTELFNIFIEIYDQMIERKEFKQFVSVKGMNKMNKELDEELKLRIFIVYQDDIPLSGLVGTAIGDTAVYLLGASNKGGMKLRSSYLAQWEMIKWAKNMGCKRYDLGGIDSKKNPGGYKFKLGVSKDEVTGVGTYETYNSWLSKIIVGFGEFIKR